MTNSFGGRQAVGKSSANLFGVRLSKKKIGHSSEELTADLETRPACSSRIYTIWIKIRGTLTLAEKCRHPKPLVIRVILAVQ
jgi:hypothetical protein